jgi:CHAT domain
MAPEALPKTKASPAKKILLIVAGAAAATWFVQQRNTTSSGPAPSDSRQSSAGPSARTRSSIANDMSVGPTLPSPGASSNAAPPTSPDSPQNEQVEKYPMIDCPNAVRPQREFPVMVSLMETRDGAQTIIEHGQHTPDGKLIFSLPHTQEDSWKLDIVLVAPDLQLTRGNTGSIDLPRQGDATPAVFYAKAGPELAAGTRVNVTALISYKKRYLARVSRDLLIEGATAGPGPIPPPNIYRGALTATQGELSGRAPPPDLTVFIIKKTATVWSPYLLSPVVGTLKDHPEFAGWFEQHAQNVALAARGAHTIPIASAATGGPAIGFGRQLYEKYAPDAFKTAFWAVAERAGNHFRTIQIYSDDPQIPWELMVPVGGSGDAQPSFLGLDYSVARWLVTDDGVIRDHPPDSEIMQKTFVVAPHYTGDRSLDGEALEIRALAQRDGYSAVNGNKTALQQLFSDPPQGIVHFAGHGMLSETSTDFAILLEDGELDTTTWRDWASPKPKNHPFFFFNACDVGQTKHSGDFVDGWAPAVLEAGASGYIGALWPVDDQVAAKFSVLFYKLLDDEMKSGSADVSATLERTRSEIYQSTRNPTALGYVLYGDTNLKFIKAR